MATVNNLPNEQLENMLIKIAGVNALKDNCSNTQKLCKAINYLSLQLHIQLNAFTDDNDKQEVREAVQGVREQAANILK